MRTKLSYLLLVLATVFLAGQFIACGGGSSGDGNTVGAITVENAANQIESDLGEDGGLRATHLAMDNGYSVGQVAAAGTESRLQSSGQILDAAGNVEAPTYTPLGAINPSSRVLNVRADDDQPINLTNLVEASRRDGQSLGLRGLVVILLLANNGYAPDQITEALLFGSIQLTNSGNWVVRGVTGDVLVPGRPQDAGLVDQSSLEDDIQNAAPDDATDDSTDDPASGMFTCGDGTMIAADRVCNSAADCADGSDESDATCSDGASCCVATQGCPSETGSSCGDGCCCCGIGEACDQGNWANGCVAHGGRIADPFHHLSKLLNDKPYW